MDRAVLYGSRLIGAAMLAALCLSGCGSNELRWSEEVVLPDNRVVTLKRVQHFDKGDYVGAHSFEFEHPTTKKIIKWESDGFFRLVAIFDVQSVPYILVKPTFGVHDEQAGCPYPSMFIYRFNGLHWQQISYKESPLRTVDENVTVDPKADRDHILANNHKIARGNIRVRKDPVFPHRNGLYLDKYPDQIFQCPKQKKIDFQ